VFPLSAEYVCLKPLSSRRRIPELFQFQVETIHQRQIQTAHLAIVVAVLEVVQGTPGF